MAITRLFFDWSRPALSQVADYLLEHFGGTAAGQEARVIVAVPGGRAERRLLELLVNRAAARGRGLVPPQIVTVGRLPELLYRPQKPWASPLTQQLAWVKAVAQCGPQVAAELFPAAPPEGDLFAWLALGDLLGRLHRELAGEAQDFSDVAACGTRLAGFAEGARWQALATIQRCYLEVLDQQELWDKQTARLYAIRHGECRTQLPLVLVGTVDLNRSLRFMLDQVEDQVTAVIFAPPQWAGHFDEHGCLRPEAWQEQCLPLKAEQIEIADDPAGQAAAVVRAMSAYEGRFRADEIVVGVPDERLVPYVQQHLEQCDVRARYGAGRPLEQTGPYRLLEAVAAHLESRRFSTFAALVRHPAVHDWLSGQGIAGDWLTALDEYYRQRLPQAYEGLAEGTRPPLSDVDAALRRLLAGLAGPPRPLDQWAQPLLDLVVQVFGQRAYDAAIEPDRTILAACRNLREAVGQQAAIPRALLPKIDGAQAIRLALAQLRGQLVPPPNDAEAVELLGWLELPLDDAPAVILTGVNEGIIPSSLNADLFLPNGLRRALGIEDNDRRAARDAYTLALLAQSRPSLRVIAGRRTAAGDPLPPSRLLFACPDAELAQRVDRFFKGPAAAAPAAPHAGPSRSQLKVPPPDPLPLPVTSMRVTEFRDYLACPYRYYLRHVLKLGRLDDAAEELDAASFGSLAHQVLDTFGRNPAAQSHDCEVIAEFLSHTLDGLVRQRFGTPLAAVMVQVEQLRVRLRAFAGWQAAWAAQGWHIEHVETDFDGDSAWLEVDGRKMFLRGRIDRIDFNPQTGHRAVLDYKWSDTAKSPEQVHLDNGQWVDLQLPLYRHLVKGLGIEGPVELGYIVVPKDVSQVGGRMAPWTAADLDAADHTAGEVVRGVWAERFWPPALEPPAFCEDFAAICQDGQFAAAAEFAAGLADGADAEDAA